MTTTKFQLQTPEDTFFKSYVLKTVTTEYSHYAHDYITFYHLIDTTDNTVIKLSEEEVEQYSK
jgi:hypothetical protein